MKLLNILLGAMAVPAVLVAALPTPAADVDQAGVTSRSDVGESPIVPRTTHQKRGRKKIWGKWYKTDENGKLRTDHKGNLIEDPTYYDDNSTGDRFFKHIGSVYDKITGYDDGKKGSGHR